MEGKRRREECRGRGKNSKEGIQLKWQEHKGEKYRGIMKDKVGRVLNNEREATERWEDLLKQSRKQENKVIKKKRKSMKEKQPNKEKEYEGEARQQRRKVWKCMKKYLETKQEAKKLAVKGYKPKKKRRS